MKWTPKKKKEKRKTYFNAYAPWFAWYPVELDTGEKVWLEWIMAKYEVKSDQTSNVFGAPERDYYSVWSYVPATKEEL